MAMKIVTDASVYTAATRILSGCDSMTPAGFVAGDVGRAVVWSDGVTVYIGRIKRVVSASSVELQPSPTLPAGNSTPGAGLVYVLDQGETHPYSAYLTRVRTLVQDDVNRLTDDEYKEMLAAAVTDYGEDRPLFVSVKVAGDGTQLYSMATMLGALWQHGSTYIQRIEYPTGDVPPTVIDSSAYSLYDDGTAQDGSNIVLMFTGYTPQASEYFVVTVRIVARVPEVGAATLPDTDSNFNNVTLLAAAYACFALASSYALSTDSTIVGDAVNYADKMDKYLRLGRTFLERYNVSVFGSENPTSTAAAATVAIELERRASDRGAFLYH